MEEMVQAMKNVKYVPNTERMDRRRGWKYLRQMAKNSKKLKVGKVDETIKFCGSISGSLNIFAQLPLDFEKSCLLPGTIFSLQI